jgi:trans-2,3-dihydro-3-hydroxyanthranilate isomerase
VSKRVGFLQVDAFTAVPFHGNPAGVVLDARGLDEGQMLAIAREVAVSETVFVFPPDGKGRHRFRWFTPTVEVEFCGHATLAATHALVEAGAIGSGEAEFTLPVDALIGRLDIAVKRRPGQGPLVMIQVPLSEFEPVEPAVLERFLEALDLDRGALDPGMQPMRYRAKLFLPLKELKAVQKLKPDFVELEQLGNDEGLSVCPVTLQTLDPSHAVHLRYFAPIVGIPEDPVTGAANAPLGAYLYLQGAMPRLVQEGRAAEVGQGPQVFRYTSEQGDSVGRPGRPIVEVTVGADGTPSAVRVGGEAITVIEGSILVG